MKVLLALVLVIGAAPAVAAPDVHVLAVGTNESYRAELKTLKFAETDARRFAEAMQTVGLVPAVRATVVTETTVKSFRQAFRTAATLLEREGKEDGHGRKFIFYFSGHSDDSGLHMKDGLISKAELHDQLSTVQAHTKIAILDSCFSGAITAKGVETAPAFELPRMEFDEPSGSVFLTASTGRQLAFESDDLGGSIFTHHLVQGLYGEADVSGDGVVTVDELYQHVYRNTKWQSLNYPTRSAQEPEYVAKLQGQGAIVLSFPAKTNAKLTLAKDLGGDITIASARGIQFFKVHKREGQEKTIQLPVGAYQLSVQGVGEVGSGVVRIEPSRLAFLGRKDMSWRSGQDEPRGLSKGLTAELTDDAQGAGGDASWAVLLGVHSGYVAMGPPGLFVEVARDYVLAEAGRSALLAGFAANFHRNGADDGSEEPEPVTDSTAGFVTAAVRWRVPRVQGGVAMRFGLGEAYHDQSYGSPSQLDQGGIVPALFLGIDATLLRNGRRIGVALRRERMVTEKVSETADHADASILAVSASL